MVGIDLNAGRRVGEADVSLPAGVVVSGDMIWVTSAETDELIGIKTPSGVTGHPRDQIKLGQQIPKTHAPK